MSEIRVDNITDEAGTGRPAFTNGVQTSNINGGQVGGRRNLIINGAMQVWQRGISHTSGGLDYHSVDRFWTYLLSGTFQKSSDVPSGSGLTSSIFIDGTVNALGHPLELPETGKTQLQSNTDYTLSFWIKAASGTSADVAVRYRDGKGSPVGNVNLPGSRFAFSVNSDWNRVEITFNTGSAVPTSNNKILDIEFSFSGLTDLYLTGVQLEVGDTATEFEHRSIGEELALCQRYYEISRDSKENFGGGGMRGYSEHPSNGSGAGTTSREGDRMFFKVTKRASPTVTPYSYNGTADAVSGITGGGTYTNYGLRTDSKCFNVYRGNYGSLYVWFDWEADAEL